MSGGTTAPVTSSALRQRLDEHGIEHVEVQLDHGAHVVVSQRGARIYGPFWSGQQTCETWLPDAFGDAGAFAELIGSRHWNLGGERLWIGPEIQYMIPDRQRYWESYHLPDAMDPGAYQLRRVDGGCELRHRMRLQAHTLASGPVSLQLRITVAAAANPLRATAAGTGAAGLRYAGYTQRVEMEQVDGQALSESWNLVQVRAGGCVIVPALPAVEVSDYYEPGGDLVGRHGGAVTARVTGDQRYKIGLRSPHVFGRAGYLRRTGDGASLLVRNTANDPSSVYAEESDVAVGVHGDSLHVYNDDGGLGGFGEVEARGLTVGPGTGRDTSTDEFTSWWWSGSLSQVDHVARQLLGTGLEGL